MILAYSYIRFSTAEQAKGDSLRRQIELREKYLAGKNLQLDETLTMRDLGVSAFKGANADEGALGSFLQAIDEGIAALSLATAGLTMQEIRLLIQI